MLNHTSLQLSGVLPKKHLNLQQRPIDQLTMQLFGQQNKEEDMGILLAALSRSTLRGGGGGSTSFTGWRHRELWKKYLIVILDFLSLTFVKWKCRKRRLWWGGFWYFSCFGLGVRQSSDACVDRCVFIQEQICLRTPTNMFHINWQIYFAWSNKYISFLWQIYFKITLQICLFGPTNIFTKCINIPIHLTGFWLFNPI